VIGGRARGRAALRQRIPSQIERAAELIKRATGL
jgi:hypothetical protein